MTEGEACVESTNVQVAQPVAPPLPREEAASGSALGPPWAMAFGIWLFAFCAPLPNHTAVSDTWFQLAAGRWMAEHHQLLRTNLFSGTAHAAPWINCEWLSQLAFWASYRAGGLHAVAVLGASLASLMVLTVFLLMLRRTGSGGASLAATLVFGVLVIPACPDRPLLFTMLAVPVLLLILEGHRQWLVAPLMAAWANLHGGVVFGAGVLVLWAVFTSQRGAAEGQAGRRGPVLVALGGLAATLLNPFGAGICANAIHSQTSSFTQTSIQEWLPSPLTTFPYVLLLTLPMIAALALAPSMSHRRPFDTCLLILVTLMAIKSRRHAPLFAIVAAPYILEGLLPFWKARIHHTRPKPAAREPAAGAGWLEVVSWAALLLLLAVRVNAALRTPVPTTDSTVPPRVLALLRQRADLPLLNPYQWGGHLIFTCRGRPPVFVDGRCETAYPDRVLQDYSYVADAKPSSEEVLDRYNIQTVAWPSDGPICQMLLYQPNWVRVYQGDGCCVFVRRPRE